MFRYETLKPLVSLTEVYESRLLSRNISYDQVLVSQKSHKLIGLQFINSTGMSLMFKYFTFFFKKKRIALRDDLTLQFNLPMISFHQEKKRLKALGHTNTSPVVRPLPYAWAQTSPEQCGSHGQLFQPC